MVDCKQIGSKFSVTFLYVTSIFVLLAGIATLSVGIWLFTVSDNISYLLDEVTLFVVAIMTIVVGTLSILAGLFGFYGNSRKNKYIIITYAIVVAFIISVEFGAGVTALVYQDKVRYELEDNLEYMIRYEYTTSYRVTEAKSAIDYLQNECKCCGADGPIDWYQSAYYWDTGKKVPESCCAQGKDCVDDSSYRSSGIYQEGCTVKGGDWMQENLVVAGATCLAIIPVHGIAILAVVCFRWLVPTDLSRLL
ncbi:tetraspanin-11-like [Antedon mediterranea]|uniref:tetraspanin-11-like n=1 Tax=Antedon mediterranea TaxID=105859 RepID=UPI003AF81E98